MQYFGTALLVLCNLWTFLAAGNIDAALGKRQTSAACDNAAENVPPECFSIEPGSLAACDEKCGRSLFNYQRESLKHIPVDVAAIAD